jgi:hypothetical protein
MKTGEPTDDAHPVGVKITVAVTDDAGAIGTAIVKP